MVELLAVATEDVEVDVFGSDPTDVDVWGEFSSNGAGATSGAWAGFDKEFQQEGDEGTARTEDTSLSSRNTAQSNSLISKRSGHQKRLSKHIVPSTIHRKESDADDSTLSEKSLRSKSSHSAHSNGSGGRRQRSRRNLISKHSNSNRGGGQGAPPRLERAPSQSSFKRSGSMKRDSSHKESSSSRKEKQPESAELVRRTQSLCVSSIQSRDSHLRRGHRRSGSGRSGTTAENNHQRRSSSSRAMSLMTPGGGNGNHHNEDYQKPRRVSSLRGGRMDPYRHAMEDDPIEEEEEIDNRRPLTRKASRGPSKSRRGSAGAGSGVRRVSSLVSSSGGSSGVRRSSSLVSSGGAGDSNKQCRSGGKRPLQRKQSITPSDDCPTLQRRNSRRIEACRF